MCAPSCWRFYCWNGFGRGKKGLGPPSPTRTAPEAATRLFMTVSELFVTFVKVLLDVYTLERQFDAHCCTIINT